MNHINFINHLEKELEKVLDGNIVMVKFHDIVKGWNTLSKTEIKNILQNKIDPKNKLYILYNEDEYIYKEMIDLLNILKRDYKDMLINKMVYLINLKGIEGNKINKKDLKIKNLIYK